MQRRVVGMRNAVKVLVLTREGKTSLFKIKMGSIKLGEWVSTEVIHIILHSKIRYYLNPFMLSGRQDRPNLLL